MATSHQLGPAVIYGAGGPSLLWGGAGLFDPRNGYQPGQDVTGNILGWATDRICVIDQVPSAISAVNLAASQVPVAGTALTLVAASGAGVTINASVVSLATNTTVTGLWVIDTAPALIAFNPGLMDQPVHIYDPRTAVARNIRITSGGDDRSATFVIRGYDLYGQPMSETITGSNATVASGVKAFKFVASITPAGTLSGSAITVGTGDVYGFPLKVLEWPKVSIFYGTPPAILQVTAAATGFVAADATTVSAVTGDVRGTYALQSASDATKKLCVYVQVMPYNLSPVSSVYTGLFGLVNFTS